MNQSELIIKTAQITGISKKDVEHVLKTAGDVIGETLGAGAASEVTLPGLGKLVTTQKSAREARNPKTGETILVPAHLAIKFKAAKALKDAVGG